MPSHNHFDNLILRFCIFLKINISSNSNYIVFYASLKISFTLMTCSSLVYKKLYQTVISNKMLIF